MTASQPLPPHVAPKTSEKSSPQINSQPIQSDIDEAIILIKIIVKGESEAQIDSALNDLAKKSNQYHNLAHLLWHTSGVVTLFLKKIISIYPFLKSQTLTREQSSSVCNVLALIHTLASHEDTRMHLLEANILIYLYPYLQTINQNKNFEYLRLTSLGVIAATISCDCPTVVSFLLQSEITPLCLKIMEFGSDLSKIVATYIILRILTDENGLKYICNINERFTQVLNILKKMLDQNINSPTQRLMNNVLKCFIRIADVQSVREQMSDSLIDPINGMLSVISPAQTNKDQDIIFLASELLQKLKK